MIRQGDPSLKQRLFPTTPRTSLDFWSFRVLGPVSVARHSMFISYHEDGLLSCEGFWILTMVNWELLSLS